MKRILFLLVAWMAAWSVQAQTTQPDANGYLVKVGDQAPDFTVTLTDGSQVRLSELRGKVVMLQFTASWCGVCRKEMPFIERDIWQRHKLPSPMPTAIW